MAKVLVLGAGRLQVPAITAAKRMGHHVIAADGDRKAPGMSLADQAEVADIVDTEACLALARRERIDGVVHICSELSMLAMGRINDELNLAGISEAVARRATNKVLMRKAFQEAGAPSPRSIGVTTRQQAHKAANQIGYPLIVKPSRNSGSRGVTELSGETGPDELDAAYDYALNSSRDASVVIEQWVDGPEYSVEILAFAGRPRVLTVTDKLTSGPPYFVETGHNQPSSLELEQRRQVEQTAIEGVKALGIDWAGAHAEVKLSPDGPYLIEIGARLGGDFITTELTPRSTGIDMVAGAVSLALGEEPNLTPAHESRGSCIRYLLPRPGRVTAIEGVEQARQMPGICLVEMDVQAGQEFPEVKHSMMRAGHVVAEGATREQAVARAEAARDAIRLVFA